MHGMVERIKIGQARPPLIQILKFYATQAYARYNVRINPVTKTERSHLSDSDERLNQILIEMFHRTLVILRQYGGEK